MNRTEHLLQQVQTVSRLRGHAEHIILDFGSTIPISRDQLPNDERIKLHRVESPNGRWWLTHSYNLAFALASGDYILKLDADILPSQRFIDAVEEQQATTNAHLMCNRLTLQDWSLPSELFTSNGLFLCKQSSLSQINGFNPYIQGWGWDDIDLYSRFFLAGYPISRIPQEGVSVIEHGNASREPPICRSTSQPIPPITANLGKINAGRRMSVQNLKNKFIAIASITASLNWPSLDDYAHTYYKTLTLPVLPKAVLFSDKEKTRLVADLREHLLKPSLAQHLAWHAMAMLRLGPYTRTNTLALLEACNLDLGLVF
jgi:glycosyltransferase involved in cell wall biosynthesis